MSLFKALNYSSQNVGKRIKKTKKKITWNFELDSRNHRIDMYVSKLSGKIKILLDGDIKVDIKRYPEIDGSYPIKIRTRTAYVYQVGEYDYDLRVGKVSFYKLMLEKERKISSWEQDGLNFQRINSSSSSTEIKKEKVDPVKSSVTPKSQATKNPFDRKYSSSSEDIPQLPNKVNVPSRAKQPSASSHIDLLDIDFDLAPFKTETEKTIQHPSQGNFFTAAPTQTTVQSSIISQMDTQSGVHGMSQSKPQAMPRKSQGITQGMSQQGISQEAFQQGMPYGMLQQGVPQGMFQQGVSQSMPQQGVSQGMFQQGVPHGMLQQGAPHGMLQQGVPQGMFQQGVPQGMMQHGITQRMQQPVAGAFQTNPQIQPHAHSSMTPYNQFMTNMMNGMQQPSKYNPFNNL